MNIDHTCDPPCLRDNKLQKSSPRHVTCRKPVNWKDERIRKTVDKLLKRFNASRCCTQCPDQAMRISCDAFKHALQFIQHSSSNLCHQTDRQYEREIVDEIMRRMKLGLCGHVQAIPPKLDYVETSKKQHRRKRVDLVPKKVEHKPKVVKPKPVEKKPPKIKPALPPRIVFLTPKNFKIDDTPVGAGTIQYKLSDRSFITKGWTKLSPAQDHMVSTFYTFPTKPCGPLLDSKAWKNKQSFRFYPNGKKMATIERDGTIQVFYPTCENDLAIHVIPKDANHFRVVVYFNRSNRDLPAAAIFDSFGNGVVYDIGGRVRLKYDQAEGKLYDFPDTSCYCFPHPPLHWKWQSYQQVTMKRQLLHHQNYGCPNIVTVSPNLKRYLPQQRTLPGIIEAKPLEDDMINGSKVQSTSKDTLSPLADTAAKAMSKATNKIAYSNSSDKSNQSNSPSSRIVQKSKKNNRRKVPLDPYTFEICASELGLNDPLLVKQHQGQANVQTPVRVVMRIEKGVQLVIMDQCHIHINFQANRQHLTLNLGVHVQHNDDLAGYSSLRSQPGHPSPPPDMFRIMEPTSRSLQSLLRPHRQVASVEKACTRVYAPRARSGACVSYPAPEEKILKCDLKKGEIRPQVEESLLPRGDKPSRLPVKYVLD